MANALRLEQMLHAGQFRSLADIRMTYGLPVSAFYLGVGLPNTDLTRRIEKETENHRPGKGTMAVKPHSFKHPAPFQNAAASFFNAGAI